MDSRAPDFVKFASEMATLGFAVFPGVVKKDLLGDLRVDIPARETVCQLWRERNGVSDASRGAAHHVVGGSDSLAKFLALRTLHEHIESHFGSPYILNSFGAVDNLPVSNETYAHTHTFHRDIRTYSPNFKLMLNALVMVDDFTIANGATRFIPGSHLVEARPTEAQIEQRSVQIEGAAGTIVLFDSNVWHSASPNLTDGPRKALTLTYTRPFFKQQLDYPRMLGESYTADESLRQLLGYNSRVPISYDEWYQPPQKRMYKPGQG